MDENQSFSDLADALYAFGAFTADAEWGPVVLGGLDKQASEELGQAEQEIAEAIEEGLEAVNIEALDDEVTLQKEAQAAAGIILQGYADQFEKLAEAAPGRIRKALSSLNKNKAAIGGGAAAGAALTAGGMAIARKRGQTKQASELTVDEIADEVMERIAVVDTVADGIAKIAADGGGRARKAWEAIRGHVGKHSGKYTGAGMAGSAATGYGLGRRGRKKQEG